MGNVPVGLWAGFFALVLVMLAIDLGVSRRRGATLSLRTAAVWTSVWIGTALIFNAGIYLWRGPEPALEFFTAYLIEKALSVDNLFVFVLIFAMFGVPPLYHLHRLQAGLGRRNGDQAGVQSAHLAFPPPHARHRAHQGD